MKKKNVEIAKEEIRQIMDPVEEESRAPIPWQHELRKSLDRIERILKWLVRVQKINLYDSGSHFLFPHDKITAIHNLPDIGDILEEKE